MKKNILINLIVSISFFAVSTTANARTPDTYKWDIVQPGAFIWETINGWAPNDLSNIGLWPTISGDHAIFSPPNSQTQSLGNFQVWITSDKTIGDLNISITNEQINIAEQGTPLLVFDDPSKDTSSIVFTNARPINADGSLNDLKMIFWETTKIILSNDLIIAGITPENPSNAVGLTEFMLYDNTMIFGNGHDITFNGPGWITPGWYDDSVAIQGVNKFVINGGLLRMFESPTFDSPLYVNSTYDCNNEQSRGTYVIAGENFDMDLVLSNAYVESWYSNWLKRYLSGTMVIRDFVLMNVHDTTGGTDLIWTNVVQSAVSGDGAFYKGYSNEESGFVEFTGSISPGENGNGSLHFYSPMGDRVSFGLPSDRLELNMDINGMRSYSGIDSDIFLAENISAIDLGNINLTVNVPAGAQTNPYRTNELMYSFDNAFAGDFNSVTWSDPGRTGELIVTPDIILVTGIPPLSNFFDIYADRVVLVKGETQQILIARSPFEMDVNVVADESWISVPAVISLSNDASVSVSVIVPADQPLNDLGRSSGSIRFSSAADPSVFIDEDVLVLEPGYFELNKSKLWFTADAVASDSMQVYSPLTVGVQAYIEDGASWLSIDGDSTVFLTNGGKYVYFDVTAQPAGTTGLVSFTNIDISTVRHDVPVEIVDPGFFEVSPKSLVFATGETQKYINVSSPFRADVNISSADSWIAVSSSVSLDGNGYSVPVMIPENQASGSTGTITFVNSCFTNIMYITKIIVSIGGPDSPANVYATDGIYPDKVQVEWSVVTNATKYKVYRNTFDSSSSSIDISGELLTTNFNDTSVTPGQLYYYWVKTGNSSGWSDFSLSDGGYAKEAGGFIIDGKNITGDFANATWKVYQDVADDWGGNNIVAMYIETNDTHLLVGIPGYVNNNAVGLLLDVNSDTGTNVMPSGLTMPNSISVGMAGMSFDIDFTPDLTVALRTADKASDDAAWPALENINADLRTYLGTLDDIRVFGSTVTNGNTIIGALMVAAPSLGETNTFPEGLELAISYDDLDNNSPTVRVMAVITSNDGSWANNQTLPPSGGNTNWQSSPSVDHNAKLVPGNQYLTIILPFSSTNVLPPFVNITNENTSLAYAISQYTIGGTNSVNVVGGMTWSNQLTGIQGSLPASLSWTIPNIGLNVGANVIVVTGTNIYGTTASDSVTITRQHQGTESDPYSIAEARALPANSTMFWAQGYIVGGRYDDFDAPFINNYGISCADSDSEINIDNCLQVKLEIAFRDIWGLQTHPENIGKLIKFHGFRDSYGGKPSFEGVDQIIEVYPDPNVPIVDITNQNTTVVYAISQYTIGGTNNAYVVGTMTWSNQLTGITGNLSASPSWTIPNIALDVGANVIVVTGTNINGTAASNSVTITRETPANNNMVDNHSFNFGLAPPIEWAPTAWSIDAGGAAGISRIFDDSSDAGTNCLQLYTDDQNDGTYSQTITDPASRMYIGAGTDTVYWSFAYKLAPSGGGGPSGQAFVALLCFDASDAFLGQDFIFITNGIPTSWINVPIRTYNLPANTDHLDILADIGTWPWSKYTGIFRVDNFYVSVSPLNITPFVNITNENATVNFDVAQYTIGGTNNADVVGGMIWSNQFTGITGTLSASSSWTIPNIVLNVGANLIVVTGTNIYGNSASDSVTITRDANTYSGVTNIYEFAMDSTNLSIQPIPNDLWQSPGTTNFIVKGDLHGVVPDGTLALYDSTAVGNFGPAGHGFFDGYVLFQDGISPTNDVIIHVDFSIPKRVDEIHVFSNWGDQRQFSYFEVWASTTGTNDSDYTKLGVAQTGDFGETNDPPSVACYRAARLYDTSGAPLANNVVSIKFVQKNVGYGIEMGKGVMEPPGTPQGSYDSITGSAEKEIDIIGANIINPPFVTITNQNTTVNYDVSQYTIGGTNNNNVVGGMSWSNQLTGITGTLPSALNWSLIDISLNVGANTIIVSGTNMYGAISSDSVTITRGNPGTGSPFVDVTNNNAYVTYDVTQYTIGGTNNVNIIGGMTWENSNTGHSGSLSANPNWIIADISLDVGANIITVSGTNVYGTISNNSVTITRGQAGTGVPLVGITNESSTVTYDVNKYSLHGINNANVIGGMNWSNNLTGVTGTFPASLNWSITDITLDVGANVIVVTGTNLYGATSSDSVIITRGVPGTGIPVVDVTNENATVTYDVTKYTVGGTDNTNVVGGLIWSNQLTGVTGVLPATPSWNITDIDLDVGANIISVTGTNLFGTTAVDSVTITRGVPGTGVPFLDVTNDNAYVTYDVLKYVVSGTNNPNIIGKITWSNELTGLTGYTNSSSSWTIENIGLGVGTNLIMVTGTNLYGTKSSDSVTITRGIPGTGVPFVDVTTENTAITYDELSYTISGTNNANIVGGMTWFNSATGKGGPLSATPTWSIPGIALNVSANSITVYGTNIYGVIANDEVIITRGQPGTGVPFIDVTNESTTVTYDVLEYTIGGTNNANVVGAMTWLNSLTGNGGTLSATSNWAVTNIALNVGANGITVFGTNVYGATVNDNITITRGVPGTGVPVVDVITADATVTYDVTEYAVDGVNNTNVVGEMNWSNQLTGVSGILLATPTWSIADIAIDVGANLIVVTGTNLYGDASSDNVTITRGNPGTGEPFVDVTTSNSFVTYDVTSCSVSGTNNINVIGDMSWLNSLTGMGGTHPATLEWSILNITLNVGTNSIAVYGTNAYGALSSGSVNIIRGEAGTGVPFVDITNEAETVTYTVTSYTIGGTNNANIVGITDWINSLTGEKGDVLISNFQFQVSDISLDVGDNLITVSGTNLYGQSTNSVISIQRKTLIESEPHIATNALIFPVANSELYEGDLTNIVWDIESITDVMNSTNLTITKISVYDAAMTNEIAIVTNDVSNLLGSIPWYVPEYLIAGDTNYLMRFEVVNSSSLTNSRIFFDNEFTVVPEAFSIVLLIALILLISKRKMN